MFEPIYTAANCKPAYQLNWSLSVFWHEPVDSTDWLEPLKDATRTDGIRILKHRLFKPTISQFFVSTKPDMAPQEFVRLVKGRLQYLVRETRPKPFLRKYGFRSFGASTRETVENYVLDQLGHHRMTDPKLQKQLERYQVVNESVDLSKQMHSTHAAYWYNLHIVIVNDERYMEVHDKRLTAVRDMLIRASAKHGRPLSRAFVLPDHVHMVVGCKVKESPAEVVICYMNNLSFALGMQRVFRYGYYVGTIGEYDRGVI